MSFGCSECKRVNKLNSGHSECNRVNKVPVLFLGRRNEAGV